MPKIAIIILHWHNTQQVDEILQQISEWNLDEYHTILIDNSQDFSSKSDWSWLTIITPSTNLGFAAGCNTGIEKAIERNFNHVLLLNADVSIHAAHVSKLKEVLESDATCVAVAPVLQEKDDGKKKYHKGGRNPLTHSNTRITCDHMDDICDQADYLPGTVLLIKLSAWKSIGPFDENYFFSGEIADWFLRLNKTSMDFKLVDEVIVQHHSSGNEDYRKKHYIYYSLRNRYLFINKFGGENQSRLTQIWTKSLRRQMVGALLRFNFLKFMTVYQAAKDGNNGRFGYSPKF